MPLLGRMLPGYHTPSLTCIRVRFILLALQEGELLALAKSVGREKTAFDSVTHQLEEARQLAEQRQSQLEAMQGVWVCHSFGANNYVILLLLGNHQLEVAQLSIKLREVMAELEEVQFACSQHHIIPGSNASSTDHGGSSKAGESPEEHIYEEPPEEV